MLRLQRPGNAPLQVPHANWATFVPDAQLTFASEHAWDRIAHSLSQADHPIGDVAQGLGCMLP